MDGFSQVLWDRMPLAEAVMLLLRHVAPAEFVNDVFDRHRGRCYQGDLSFDNLVELVQAALLVHAGSGRQSFEQARQEDRLDVTNAAAYGKLRRVPLAVSEALLAETGDRLREIQPAMTARRLPACLGEFVVFHVDGKKIKCLAKRLKPLRGVSGSLLGGKVLVALAARPGLAVAFAGTLDGEANDAPLVPALLPQVRTRVSGRRLWIVDRQFCDLIIPALLSAENDAFLSRHCLKLHFHADPSRPARESRDAQGRLIREEWGWIGGPRDPRRMAVRRITLERPGEESVIVLTNLLEGEQYPAADLLAAYRERWQIERVFQQVTEVFQLQRLIGSSPAAAVFQASFCLLLYNLIQTLRGYVAQEHDREPETISSELLFRDVQRQLICWTELGHRQIPARILDQSPVATDVQQRLSAILRLCWSNRWQKSPAKQRWRPTTQVHVPGGHSSAWKILQAPAPDG